MGVVVAGAEVVKPDLVVQLLARKLVRVGRRSRFHLAAERVVLRLEEQLSRVVGLGQRRAERVGVVVHPTLVAAGVRPVLADPLPVQVHVLVDHGGSVRRQHPPLRVAHVEGRPCVRRLRKPQAVPVVGVAHGLRGRLDADQLVGGVEGVGVGVVARGRRERHRVGPGP